jgi:hypothetical protein
MGRQNPDRDDDGKAHGDVFSSENGAVRNRASARNRLTEDNTPTDAGDGLSRRHLLASGAVLITAASAGCLGNILGSGSNTSTNGTGSSTSTQTPSSPVIKSFEIKGNNLLINVVEDADITGFRLISPDDEEAIDTAYLRGTTQASISLVQNGNPITGGIYTILIYDGREVVGETTIPIKAHPKVVGVKLVSGSDGPVPQATVTNTGRLPTPIQYVGFPDNVPAPKPVPDTLEGVLNVGLARVDKGEDPLISKGEKGTFRGTDSPFYFDSDDVPSEFSYDPDEGADQIRAEFCRGETVDTTLLVIVGGKRFEFPTTVTYDGEVEIQDALGGTFICSNVSADIRNVNGTTSGNGTSGTTTE